MKKLLCVILTVVLFLPTVAMADVDLSGMTFAELAALRDQCQAEMMKRDEWQEVVVPQGIWEVGAQIPAGKWIVTCYDTGRTNYLMQECKVMWGKGHPTDGQYWNYQYELGSVDLYNPNNTNYKGQTTSYTIELHEGEFVSIHTQYNKAVFTPYTGAPSLGFK